MPPIVAVEELCHAYADGFLALRGVDLAIEVGECVALLGESGSGKTTLARHLNGLLRPTRGRVLVAGRNAAHLTVAELARTVGYVFQNPLHQLFAETVEEEIALGPSAQGWKREAVADRVKELLVEVGLERYRRRHPLALSEGERRRVALAATLAARPRLLVLDEPTVGQDQRAKAQLGELLGRWRAEGRSALVITHDAEFAFDHCTRFVVLAGGSILADAPAREVVRQSELLAAAALEAPQLARLAQLLATVGYSPEALTLEAASREIRRLVGTGSRRR